MTCMPETDFRLEFVVVAVRWRCALPYDDGCRTAVGLRFLDLAEQKLCELPAGAPGCGGQDTPVPVNEGGTFAFAPPGCGCGSCGGLRPVRVAVRLYRTAGRVELASGELDVPVTPATESVYRAGYCGCDRRTIIMADRVNGRAVAELTVQARAWRVKCPPPRDVCCGGVLRQSVPEPRPCQLLRQCTNCCCCMPMQ